MSNLNVNVNVNNRRQAMSTAKEHPGRAWLRVKSVNLETLWDRAAAYYRVDARYRPYHNLSHANQVTHALFALCPQGPTAAQIMAARWHDAVYVSAAGSNLNERMSACALARHAAMLPLNEYEQGVVFAATNLILDTTVSVHIRRGAIRAGTRTARDAGQTLAPLLDADLSGLALPWTAFKARQRAVCREQIGPERWDVEGLRTMALRSGATWLRDNMALSRPYIYHTDAARILWEDAAQRSIHRWYNQQHDV